MISAHASGKSQVALIDAKGIFRDTLDHIYFACCCKLDCNPETAKLVNEEEVTKAETRDPPSRTDETTFAATAELPLLSANLAPFDPTKKKKMKVVILDPIEDSTESQAEKTGSSPRLLMAFKVHLLDRTHRHGDQWPYSTIDSNDIISSQPKNGEMNMATGGHPRNCSESYLTLQRAPVY
ncbi:hypothetical protein F2Q69_00061533 [Brassica cretica]|uniref:Uncharacterized protein n=1 Tax=Brassica cretica TaxID=69181 RepID=A0A8S9RBX9_BRACR|nr:hypothetical protein F2Q69_00061533 [Brassica cretica]